MTRKPGRERKPIKEGGIRTQGERGVKELFDRPTFKIFFRKGY